MATRSRSGWKGGSWFSPPPHQLLFILLIVLLFVFLSWYMAYESAWEGTMEQLKTWLMVSPLLLLLAVRWLAATGSRPIISLPRSHPNAIHTAGSSPWGVGLLLILLLVMISYQSVFHDQWFPLFRSRD